MGGVCPGTYKISEKVTGGIQLNPKDIGFFYGKDKKTGCFTEGAKAKQYIPGTGAYTPADIYKKKPTMIFKCGEKRNGPIDQAIASAKKTPGFGAYFKDAPKIAEGTASWPMKTKEKRFNGNDGYKPTNPAQSPLHYKPNQATDSTKTN